MKRLAFAVLVALFVGLPTAEAQTIPDAQPCVQNLGRVPYYEPVALGDSLKNPANGTTKIVAPLEEDACLFMITMRGWRWVPIKEGTDLRWDVASDGTKTPYAHDKCGNGVKGIVYLPDPQPTPPAVARAEALARLSVHHSFDTLHVRVSGDVGLTLPPMPQQEEAKVVIRKSNGLRNFFLGLGTAAVAVGTYFLLRGGGDEPPGVITLPPGPGVVTHPPGG